MLSYNRPCLPEELNMKGHRIFMSNAWDLNDFHYIFAPTNAMSTEYIIEKLQFYQNTNWETDDINMLLKR